MGWPKDSDASFTGGSGQMAVISELLHRKCNAAIPLIDLGTDVFAFRDNSEDLARIQVKTAPGTPYLQEPGFRVRFNIPLKQLERVDDPPLYYALAVRSETGWGPYLIISRTALKELRDQKCGYANSTSGDLEIYLQVRPVQSQADGDGFAAQCGDFELSRFLNAWESLPPLRPIEPLTVII